MTAPSTPASPHPAARWAVAVALLGVFGGSCMDAIIKAVVAATDPVTVTLWRYGVGAALTGALYWRFGTKPISAQTLKGHAVRGVVIMTTGLTFFYALSVLPLAEATTYGFVAALLVAPLGAIVLKEAIRPIAVLGALIGFAGVAAAVGFAGDRAAHPDRPLALAAIAISVVGYAMSLILLRKFSLRDDLWTVAFLGNAFPAAYLAPFALLLAAPAAPAAIPLLIVIGALGATLWLCLGWAYRHAPAQALAPLEYSAILWSAGLGYVFFNEVPAPSLYAGGALIIAACLLVAWDERRRLMLKPTG